MRLPIFLLIRTQFAFTLSDNAQSVVGFIQNLDPFSSRLRAIGPAIGIVEMNRTRIMDHWITYDLQRKYRVFFSLSHQLLKRIDAPTAEGSSAIVYGGGELRADVQNKRRQWEILRIHGTYATRFYALNE